MVRKKEKMKRKEYTIAPGSPRWKGFQRVSADILRALKKYGYKNDYQLSIRSNHGVDTIKMHLEQLLRDGIIGKRPRPDTWEYYIKEDAPAH